MKKIRNKIIGKMRSKKGVDKTILSYMVVSMLIIYLLILIGAWKIYDVKYEYMKDAVEVATDYATKKGVINTDIDLKLRTTIDKLGSHTYTYKYTPYDAIDTDGIIPLYDLAVNQKLKTGDIIYIQVKSNYEPIYSKLLNITFFNKVNPNEVHYYLVVDEGMVETNAE